VKVEVLTAGQWQTIAENAHLVVFNEKRPAEMNRIDYALLTVDGDKVPASYVTVREVDKESVYWQYGGSFPGTRGSTKSFRAYQMFIEWTLKRYKRVTTLVENTNTVYLKMALTCGFLPIGIRNFQGTILLELLARRSTTWELTTYSP
jgi:hypothetical protein